ncbi:MAG: histidine phosphatase family protein [Gemmatimonadota bacterium]
MNTLVCLWAALSLASPSDTTRHPVVVIVRHAEKASETERDPTLSAAGRARAAALDSALASAHVVAILITQFRRTAETAAPVAARHHLTPIVIPTDGGVAKHAAAVAAAARGYDGVVLVVGHSNTVMPIAAALGAGPHADLCDRSYALMFTVTPADAAGGMLRSRFGVPDPPGADSCPTMTPP